MNAKHTPGPWQVYVAEPPFQTIHIGQADDATYTPHASDVAYQTIGCDPTSVQMANARLIAAAPDLLEALSALVDMCYSNGERWIPPMEFIETARIAISKATEVHP